MAFNGNPVTRVRINAEGFRGADFAPPTAGEVLVVGDSQVFGLGVEENETFSAELSTRTGRPVLDLGVPTYGPPEYNAILEEVLGRRAAAGTVVVYTVNLANDLFESDRSNAERHAVWDGWAVRAETAPERAPWFPGRALLFRESHAVFALRTFLHRDSGAAEAGFASEGTWQDLIGAAARRKAERNPAELDALVEEEKAAQLALERAAVKAYPAVMGTKEGKAYQQHHGNPEDIVVRRHEFRYAEGARRHEVTVNQLVEGSKIRKRIEASLRRRAEKEIEKERARAVLASLRERDAIEKKIAAVRARTEAALRTLSPLREPLERAKAICAARGAKLVVLALPIDVEVSSDEWAKYGREPLDLGEVRALTDDLLATAASLDLPALDAHDTLAAAEPGAFLHADLHMTPKGHRAVGRALAQKIASLRADR
ncbi:hypothetical protein A7982_12623 [Minicystis rosea]|nr:hypothetical protein A7982_12623 [Minicystis rosea]